jgi:hypothetical protein
MIAAIRPGTIPFAVAASMATAVGVLYLQVIGSQGDLDAVVVWFFAVLVFGVALATLVAAFVAAAAFRVYLGVSATALLVLAGILGVFTIGMPLLVAGVFTLVGTIRAWPRSEASPAVAAVVALLTLIAASALFAAAFTVSR